MIADTNSEYQMSNEGLKNAESTFQSPRENSSRFFPPCLERIDPRDPFPPPFYFEKHAGVVAA